MTETTDGEAFRRAADEQLQQAYDSPMGLEAYIDRVLTNPTAAASGPRYLLAAIESQGTRTVWERGEGLDRTGFSTIRSTTANMRCSATRPR